MHNSLFVFDIETVPDTEAVRNLTGFESDNIDDLRAELERYHLEITDGKNAFPRQCFHKIVAISFLEAEIQKDGQHETYILKEVRSGGKEDGSEEELIRGAFQYLERMRPRFVSFNGRGFDWPVMQFRAMKYGITAPWFYKSGDKWNGYSSRYSADWHCDLMDVMKGYGAVMGGLRLNEVCSILDLPGKFGVDGSNVAKMFDDGQVKEIRDYCETDVLNTYLVYLHHQHHTGTITTEALNSAMQDILTYLEAEKAARPYLGEFLEAWHEACSGVFIKE